MKRQNSIFITNRPKISSEEIAKHRDFDSILKAVKTIPFYKQPLFLAGLAATVVLVAAVSFYLVFNNNNFNNENLATTGINNSANETEAEKDINESSFTTVSKNLVIPPFAYLQPEYETFTASNIKSTNWKSSNGSSIQIPENAFVDKEGKFINGKVEIKYREFHDPIDFFMSGIPMTYDSGGVEYVFESAGMVEILAFQNGEPVYLNPEKKATVNMVSAQEGNRYNLYQFDTALGNWVIKGKDKISAIKPAIKQVQMASERVDQLQTSAIVKQQENIQKEIKKLVQNKPEAPRKVSAMKDYIELALDVNEFPELAVYKNVKFEVGKENANYNPKDVSAVVWEGANLAEGKTKGSYELTLSKGKNKLTYIVYPAFDGQDYEKAQQKYSENFKAYELALETKKEDQRLLEEKVKAERKNQVQIAESLIENSEETGFKVMRTMQLSGFGIWNCDAPVNNFMPYTTMVNFKNTDGSQIHLRSLYHVEKERNAILRIAPGKVIQLGYNPEKNNIIWGITMDNKLAIVPKNNIASLASLPNTLDMKMQVIEAKIKTADDVRKYLNL